MSEINEFPTAHTVRLPLPIFQSVEIGELVSRDNDRFVITIGLSKDHVDQLKKYSLDESDVEIQKNTSDRQRFGEGSYEEWYSKERTPFALIHKESNALAALVWFGPKPLGRKSLRFLSPEELQAEATQKKDEWHTVVYRAYNPYRGKGLMKAFVNYATEVYLRTYSGIRLWAGVDADNAASIALAEKLGYRKVPELVDTEQNWLAMVKES